MLAALCAPHVPTLATHRNHNNRLGVPLTLCRLEPGHELCICELGTSEVGELAELAAIAEPDVGVITNIAPEHLEFLGDLEGVAREEAALLAALPAGGEAVLPADEPLLEPFRRADLARRRSASPDGDVRCWPGAETGGTRRCSTCSACAASWSCRCAPRTTPRTSRLRPPPTLRAGLPLAGLGEGAADDRALALPRAGAAPRGGGVLVNDAYNANPGLDGERARRARRAARRARARSRCSGRWPSSGPRRRAGTPRSGTRVRAARHRRRDRRRGARGGYATAAAGCEWYSRPTWPPRPSCSPRVLQPGDFVLLKGSRSAGLERLAEAAL